MAKSEKAKAKAKENRAKRRSNYKAGALNIVKVLGERYDTLNDEAKHLLEVLTREYKPVVKVQCAEGDKLLDLLQKYAEVKDVFKKLNKWCEEHQLQIDVETATIVKI